MTPPLLRWDGGSASYINLRTGQPLDAFVLGETKPTRENTGLAAVGVDPNSLEVVSGNQTHTTPGATFYRKRFTGIVDTRAAGITYNECWFNGPHTASVALALNDKAAGAGTQYNFCDFESSTYAATVDDNSLGNCLFGDDFTVYRCRFRRAIDMIGVYSGVSSTTPAKPTKVHGSHLGEMLLYSPYPSQGDNRSHNDLIQIHYGCTGLELIGNMFDARVSTTIAQGGDAPVWDGPNLLSGNPYYPTDVGLSALQFSPRNQTAGNVDTLIRKNWFNGGTALIYWNFTWATGAVFDGNRWPRNMWYGQDFTILMAAGQVASTVRINNIYEDNGQSYNGTRNA